MYAAYIIILGRDLISFNTFGSPRLNSYYYS